MTLTADDLDSHARMSMPLDRVKLDVASQYGIVEVVVLHRVRVHVTFKHLDGNARHHPQHTSTPTDSKSVNRVTFETRYIAKQKLSRKRVR